MNKDRLSEIEIVRGIAITGVLVIHGTSQALAEVPIGSRSYLPYLILNKASHFSIPTFILLSGLVLFYLYFHSWNRDQFIPFYKKRLVFLLIPYVIWSVFYYFFNSRISRIPLQHLSFYDFVRKILSGSAGYHLYFVLLIVQYYLIFPCILLVMKKIDKHGPFLTLGTVLLSSILIQAASGVLNNKFEWVADKSILSSTYLTAFCLGGYIGSKYSFYSKWIKDHTLSLHMFTIAFLMGHLAL